jgi:hypothetical protein
MSALLSSGARLKKSRLDARGGAACGVWWCSVVSPSFGMLCSGDNRGVECRWAVASDAKGVFQSFSVRQSC